jgi:PAS domain S-box-containing protein
LQEAIVSNNTDRWFQTAEVYRAMIESAPDAIVVVDEDGKIVFVNQQAEYLFGYSRSEFIGQQIELLVPPVLRQLHTAHTKEYFRNPATRPMGANMKLLAQRKDKSVIPVEISLSPISTNDGTIVQSVIRDITDRKLAERALQEARDQLEIKVKERTSELEARNQELDAFAHTVAHDLKNPLTILVGMANTLRLYYSTLTDEEMEQYLAAIARDSQKMDNIINELLVLASVGQTAPQPESLQMEAIVDEALHRLEYLIKDNRAIIHKPDSWPPALGHAAWIESVWVNYLSNAIKYGGEPPDITLGADPLPNGAVKFWVKDNGVGLSAVETEKLFRPFSRLRQVKRIEGHGVGLSIVQRIVHKLDGQVGVESNPGKGSTFYFTLRRNNAAGG